MWRWPTLIGGAVKTGQAHSTKAAIAAAEKATDRPCAFHPSDPIEKPAGDDRRGLQSLTHRRQAFRTARSFGIGK